MGNSQAGVAAAQQVVAVHLPSLSGEECSACGSVYPCDFRKAAEWTLNVYGLLPRRVPGAALRAAGVALNGDQRPRRAQWARSDRHRGWFDSVINPAAGRAPVVSKGRDVT
ncbi:hypothetical protein Dvina_53015 [Dactylosporangium vinaceum]|uniref:Uncharacterized protein n=1 Tax=Dactylosporangium vinaceum TaxID=53362 RepID=A0ABV5MQ85_9ACTN|nr:hypothetical protein [Dactylosporangium vinaceum]UAB96537.1 hypothetical protein Dvina_53015 [Dactylosporangium vinaceum]